MRIHRSFHARTTHLVKRSACGRQRQTRTKRGLTRGGLTLASAEHVAKGDFFNILGGDVCARDRSFDRSRSKVSRRHRGEITLKPTHGRARSGYDNDRVDSSHDAVPQMVSEVTIDEQWVANYAEINSIK
jgi:hypothetical protein